MPEYLEEELSPLPSEEEQGSQEELVEVELEKPYLRSSDLEGSPQKEVLTLEWMEFLLSKTNVRGILDALSYYIEMGWIGRGVRSNLMSYVRYFFEESSSDTLSEVRMGEKSYRVSGGKNESSSAETSEPAESKRGKSTGKLSLNDHLRSLGYILKISDRAGEEVQEAIMQRVRQ